MKKRGFTLIELMIVVAIIGILLAMLLPRIGVLIDRSREKTTQKNLKNIYTAIVQYSQKRYGRMVWPATTFANPRQDVDPEVRRVLLSTDTTINPEGPPFDDVPPALLRRGAKDLMGQAAGPIAQGDPNLTQNNRFYPASGRLWTEIHTDDQNEGGWCYITQGTYTGEVFVNSSILDTFGQIYSTYPCW